MTASGTALVIIDLQWAMFAGIGFGPLYESEKLLDRASLLLGRARQAKATIIYVQHAGPTVSLLAPGSAGWQIHRSIAPLAGELVVAKTQSDAFLRTSLQEELEGRDIERLVLAGAQTDACVDTTCRRAFSLGYEVILAEDAHSTVDLGNLTAAQIIDHHNRILGDEFAKLCKAEDIHFGS